MFGAPFTYAVLYMEGWWRMGRDWESSFRAWSEAPSPTEQDKAENAQRAISKAILASTALGKRDVRVFAQGSYENRTNVRTDSDVDICVCCQDSFFFDKPANTAQSQLGISSPASYQFPAFKNDVETALRKHFGTAAVKRGKKAFDIRENTYRIAADVVPAFAYRDYGEDGHYREGTAFETDEGTFVKNWPEQNYSNGVRKNQETGESFKGMVRLLKRLRHQLVKAGVSSAEAMSSFLIECLVWNVPNEGFAHSTWAGDVRFVLAYLFEQTKTDSLSVDWCEINDIKYLFRPSQPWTRNAVTLFCRDCWSYLEF